MAGEIYYFRKQLIGGFDRQDVVDYIAKLAIERNENAAAKDKALQDAKTFASEVASLRLELKEAGLKLDKAKADLEIAEAKLAEARIEIGDVKQNMNKRKIEALESAINMFLELETSAQNLNNEVKSSVKEVCAEMDAVCATVAGAPSILERAGEKIAGLRADLVVEKELAAGAYEHQAGAGQDSVQGNIQEGDQDSAGESGQYSGWDNPGSFDMPKVELMCEFGSFDGPTGYAEQKTDHGENTEKAGNQEAQEAQEAQEPQEPQEPQEAQESQEHSGLTETIEPAAQPELSGDRPSWSH